MRFVHILLKAAFYLIVVIPGCFVAHEKSGAEVDTPLLVLLIDTSGSMENRAGCICESRTQCANCLPSCNADFATDEKNRWAAILEAFTGTWPPGTFACEQYTRDDRSAFGFDFDYHIPYHQPWACDPAGSGPCTNTTIQVEDGALDAYQTKIRFGLATFDTQSSYLGEGFLIAESEFGYASSLAEDGMWSYGPYSSGRHLHARADGTVIGKLHFPSCTETFIMDTGIKSGEADQGALVAAVNDDEMELINDRIQTSLINTRPHGGTPTAAALDDIHYFLENDYDTESDGSSTTEDRYVLLITDGRPDDDYRTESGCDCKNETECCEAWHSVPAEHAFCHPDAIQGRKNSGQMPGGDNMAYHPSEYQCAYPTAEEAAMVLINGHDRGGGLIRRLFVIGFSVPCNEVSDSDHDAYSCETWQALDTIARAGGSDSALFANTAQELRRRLEEVFREVAGGVE